MTSLNKLKYHFLNIFSMGKMRELSGFRKHLFIFIGFLLAVYQIWSVTIAKIDPMMQMAIHLSLILVLTFMLYTASEKEVKRYFWIRMRDVTLIGLAIAAGVYFILHIDRLSTRAVGVDALTTWDIFFGLVFVILSIEAARRTIGFLIIAVALIFMGYALYGHHLTGVWYHYEMSPTEVLDQLAFSLNGLWGSPIAVAASFVFIFVLFGAFLQYSGASEFFFKLSVALAGRSRGGAAKIAVLASGFFGTISGSPTANVVTTGPFTIPMAKKLGYSPRFAAAIEACASTGGSFLPPIMGSSAFLMAAITGIPYGTIAIAALLPGMLYYVSLISIVHIEAVRLDLPRAAVENLPKLSQVLKSGWYHFIPLIILVVLLFQGLSPSRTGFYGILTIVLVSYFTKNERMNLKKIYYAMADGSKSAIAISTACAAAGLVIAGIMSTGLGGKLNSIILGMTAGQLLPTLILVMLMCIILGMGMPVAAAYVLTAMLAAPALISLGISELAAHLFIVYFSIISAITPPVAVAAFAAAGIAQSNPTKTGFEAVRLGVASFIIPFVFVLNPALLMAGSIFSIAYTSVTTILGLIVLGSGILGYFFGRVSIWERLILIILGLSIVTPFMIVNFVAIAIVLVMYSLLKLKVKTKTSEVIN